MSATFYEQAVNTVFRMSMCIVHGRPGQTITLHNVLRFHPIVNCMMKIMGELGYHVRFEDEHTLSVTLVDETFNAIRLENMEEAPECLCIIASILTRRKRIWVGASTSDGSAAEFFKLHILPLAECGIQSEVVENRGALLYQRE